MSRGWHDRACQVRSLRAPPNLVRGSAPGCPSRDFSCDCASSSRSNGCRLTGIGYCLSMSSDEVRRRVVAVTGASGGVGRAVVQEFAKRGDSIALLSRGEVGLVCRGR